MIRPAPPGERCALLRCALLRTRTGAEKRALSSGSALPPPFRTIHVISPSRTERGERGDTSADFHGPTYAILRPAAKKRFLISSRPVLVVGRLEDDRADGRVE